MASLPLHALLRFLLIHSLFLAGPLAAARSVPVEFLYPPFNLTYFHFIDTNGVFLRSRNSTFAAALYNPGAMPSRYFLCVLHAASRTPVWTATAGSTILESIVLSLTTSGLSLSEPTGHGPAWSTPPLAEPVTALHILDTGELVLIDRRNASLWSSFSRPTDALLPGQRLRIADGVTLTSPASDQDLSPGAYRLVLTPNDALLQWSTSNGSFLTYWALSVDVSSLRDSNYAVDSMLVNASGLYLLAANGRDTVFRVPFSPPAAKGELRFVKLDWLGRLRVLSFPANATQVRSATVWVAPSSDCDLPFQCKSLGLCTAGTNGSSCGCPDAFSAYSSGGCTPADGSSLPTPDSCGGEPSSVSYMSLGSRIGYFANKFAFPAMSGDALSVCRNLCSANCSCLGFVYKNSSKSCFLLQNQIGSVFLTDTGTDAAAAAVGFIKTLSSAPRGQGGGRRRSSLSFITILFGIVLPTVAAVLITILLYLMGVQWLRRKQQKSGTKGAKPDGGEARHLGWFKLPMPSSASIPSVSEEVESDQDEVLIPGLPSRFTYADLEAATNGFKLQIGSGGFGSVYKGELHARTTVAVKRMNNLGTQGRREFLTEIAVIGNVHHVNLVKLRGFCAEGARQLLVYEYMNRGSLDQCLFPAGSEPPPPLEWPDRLRVCVGAARGLAYLHAGCARKILHCDVKPENILLDDRGGVKIADFGLAKLMNPEQSGLFTTMRGTRGYLAPEWIMNAPITDKADVYSFGMVLLEIVRGRKNSKKHHSCSGSASTSSEGSSAPGANERSNYFPALALDMHEEQRYEELVDPRLEGRADVTEVARVVCVALCCLHEEAVLRPSMTAVSGMLDGSMDLCRPRVELLRYLKMYGRGFVDFRPDNGKGKGKAKGKDSDMTGAASSSWSPPSCVSAQQLSGPR